MPDRRNFPASGKIGTPIAYIRYEKNNQGKRLMQ
jgi:hypothetical protein